MKLFVGLVLGCCDIGVEEGMDEGATTGLMLSFEVGPTVAVGNKIGALVERLEGRLVGSEKIGVNRDERQQVNMHGSLI